MPFSDQFIETKEELKEFIIKNIPTKTEEEFLIDFNDWVDNHKDVFCMVKLHKEGLNKFKIFLSEKEDEVMIVDFCYTNYPVQMEEV